MTSSRSLLLVALIGTAAACAASCHRSSSPTQSKSSQASVAEGTTDAQHEKYENLEEMYQRLEREGGDASSSHQGPGAMRQMRHQMRHMGQHHRQVKERGWCCGRGPTTDGHRHMMSDNQRCMHGGMMDDDQHRVMGACIHSGMMSDWHEQMAELETQSADQLDAAGQGDRAEPHREAAQMHREMAAQYPADQEVEKRASTEQPQGARIYSSMCAVCHGARGQGVPGAFPPLAANPVVTGEKERVTRIVQHGLTGPLQVGEQTYHGVMPAFGRRLSTAQIAAVLTYVRSAWGNQADPVSAAEVEKVGSEGRQRPWTTQELGLNPD